MSNQVISLIGWRFLPNLVTGWVQSLYYSLCVPSGKSKPLPGSEKYNRDWRRIYITIVSIYLIFTIYEADWEIRQKPDFYQVLRLSETANEKEIKARFRRLAAIHHPDKVIANSPSAEAYFVQLKLTQDTLLNPVKRFAYERFGPSILEWERCSSMRDYLAQGLYSSLPGYIGSAFVMWFFELLGYVKIGIFWRWLTFISFGVFELHIVTSPYISPILSKFINPFLKNFTHHSPLLPFQFIQLAHKISVTFYIALSQIGPFFQPLESKELLDVEVKKQLVSLEMKVKSIDAEANRILKLNLTPFFLDKKNLDSLQGKMKDWLVQNTVRMDHAVRDAIGKSLEEKNIDVEKKT